MSKNSHFWFGTIVFCFKVRREQHDLYGFFDKILGFLGLREADNFTFKTLKGSRRSSYDGKKTPRNWDQKLKMSSWFLLTIQQDALLNFVRELFYRTKIQNFCVFSGVNVTKITTAFWQTTGKTGEPTYFTADIEKHRVICFRFRIENEKKILQNTIKRAMDEKKEKKFFSRWTKKCQISPYVFHASEMK